MPSTRLRRVTCERLLRPRECVGVENVHIIEAPNALHASAENEELVPNFYGCVTFTGCGLDTAGGDPTESPGEL
jgi:hypothetical protein